MWWREILSNHTPPPPPTQSTSRATCGAKPKHEHTCSCLQIEAELAMWDEPNVTLRCQNVR